MTRRSVFPHTPLSVRLSRRRFLTALGAVSLGAGVGVTAAAHQTGDVELVTQRVAIPDLPTEFDGYRIGFLTDLHVSVNTPIALIDDALTRIERSGVDVLLLGGDYVAMNESLLSLAIQRRRNSALSGVRSDDQPEIALSQLAHRLAASSFPDGTFAVYGNHDHWVGAELCSAAFSHARVTILCNSPHSVMRGDKALTIIGTDDYWNGIPSVTSVPLHRRRGETRILLTHNPDFTSRLITETSFEFDLALSGHTHGGQICLPLVGGLFFNVQDERFAVGHFSTPQNERQSYTSRGIGVVEIPYRINCPPEATVIEIHRA